MDLRRRLDRLEAVRGAEYGPRLFTRALNALRSEDADEIAAVQKELGAAPPEAPGAGQLIALTRALFKAGEEEPPIESGRE
jgi:hypothetical protein